MFACRVFIECSQWHTLVVNSHGNPPAEQPDRRADEPCKLIVKGVPPLAHRAPRPIAASILAFAGGKPVTERGST